VNPSGNLEPLNVDSSGNLLVSLAAEPGAPLHVIVDSSALPTGAATSANQTNASQKTQIVDGSGNVIASTSNALNVQVENFPATQPISGTVTANQGSANATPWNQNISEYGGAATTLGSKVSASSIPVVVASDQGNVPVSQATASALNATVVQGTAANLNATVAIAAAQTLATVTTVGTVTTITNTVPTAEIASTTSTVTSVASSATNVTLLSSNSSRKNAMFYNDSTQILYLKLGTTASSTSYTVQLVAGAYFELPIGKIYTGEIDGIWASANGNCRITELT
jgi:hypothetical protein